MTVVADSSVVIALWRVSQIELLSLLFDEILVPPAVASELRMSGKEGSRLLEELSWFKVASLQEPAKAMALTCSGSRYKRLHLGEAQSIMLAQELRAHVLLIDERRGRSVAVQHGIRVMGVLGVLLLAKNHGILPEVKHILDQLVDDIGFRISQDLYLRTLELAGEK